MKITNTDQWHVPINRDKNIVYSLKLNINHWDVQSTTMPPDKTVGFYF